MRCKFLDFQVSKHTSITKTFLYFNTSEVDCHNGFRFIRINEVLTFFSQVYHNCITVTYLPMQAFKQYADLLCSYKHLNVSYEFYDLVQILKDHFATWNLAVRANNGYCSFPIIASNSNNPQRAVTQLQLNLIKTINFNYNLLWNIKLEFLISFMFILPTSKIIIFPFLWHWQCHPFGILHN